MSFQILYGVENNYMDVTAIAMKILSLTSEFINNKRLIIPAGDIQRSGIFGDPIHGTLKHIMVLKNDQKTIYTDNEIVNIDISDIDLQQITHKKIDRTQLNSIVDPEDKLKFIHKNLLFTNGTLMDEYPEQLLACAYLPSDAHILELGANIGRNTLIMATLLNDDKNIVTLETNPHSATLLTYNRNLNDCHFHIEDSALSKRKLIQKGWSTVPSDVVWDGYYPVKTISFQELEQKYNIKFNTLVADCEGALYYILLDDPDILNNIKLVIMENDYSDINHKNKVDELLKEKGLERIVHWVGGWGPCRDFFYEVWKKI